MTTLKPYFLANSRSSAPRSLHLNLKIFTGFHKEKGDGEGMTYLFPCFILYNKLTEDRSFTNKNSPDVLRKIDFDMKKRNNNRSIPKVVDNSLKEIQVIKFLVKINVETF